MTNLDAYIEHLRTCSKLYREGREDSPEAANARIGMRALWQTLNDKEKKIVSYLAEHINEEYAPDSGGQESHCPRLMRFVAYAMMVLLGVPLLAYLLALIFLAMILLDKGH